MHAPEFAFEKNESNVKRAVRDLGIKYPVALDNNYAIWQSFNNQYWPAHYFIDAKGHIRGHHFGEGDYDGSEELIRQLLSEPVHMIFLRLLQMFGRTAFRPPPTKSMWVLRKPILVTSVPSILYRLEVLAVVRPGPTLFHRLEFE